MSKGRGLVTAIALYGNNAAIIEITRDLAVFRDGEHTLYVLRSALLSKRP